MRAVALYIKQADKASKRGFSDNPTQTPTLLYPLALKNTDSPNKRWKVFSGSLGGPKGHICKYQQCCLAQQLSQISFSETGSLQAHPHTKDPKHTHQRPQAALLPPYGWASNWVLPNTGGKPLTEEQRSIQRRKSKKAGRKKKTLKRGKET